MMDTSVFRDAPIIYIILFYFICLLIILIMMGKLSLLAAMLRTEIKDLQRDAQAMMKEFEGGAIKPIKAGKGKQAKGKEEAARKREIRREIREKRNEIRKLKNS
jgi:predicted Holliday junction resolvase-like endonuclease